MVACTRIPCYSLPKEKRAEITTGNSERNPAQARSLSHILLSKEEHGIRGEIPNYKESLSVVAHISIVSENTSEKKNKELIL